MIMNQQIGIYTKYIRCVLYNVNLLEIFNMFLYSKSTLDWLAYAIQILNRQKMLCNYEPVDV